MNASKVIAVDLDGTLTLTDTLYEAALALIRVKPFMLFVLPFWLIMGRDASQVESCRKLCSRCN